MNEPLKEKDVIRGVIVNANEYKSDEIISPNKITERWINSENLKSAVEWLKEQIANELAYRIMNEKITSGTINMIHKYIDIAFPDLCPSGDLINVSKKKI